MRPRKRPPKAIGVAYPEDSSAPRHVFGLHLERATRILDPSRDLVHALRGGDLEGEALAFGAVPALCPVVLVQDDADVPRRQRHAAERPITLNSAVDRKSTRLNSSHGYISYAVFCLKKK